MIILLKESQQPFLRDVSSDVHGEKSRTSLVNGIFIKVGCKYLQSEISGRFNRFDHLPENDCKGISLLTRRAARHPGPQNTSNRSGCKKRRNYLELQRFPRRWITEKTGYSYQQLFEQQLCFMRVLLQKVDIISNPFNLMDTHASLNPAVDGAFFIKRKILTGLNTQKNDHFFQTAQHSRFQRKLLFE